MEVPFLHLKKHNLLYRDLYIKSFKEFLEKGNFILGEQVKIFEKEFAKYIGSHDAIGVSNCHDGLEILLKASNIGKGDEVIVPSNTFIATWLSIINVGATPVPVEPDICSLNINKSLIENAISKKTKAIIVVHLYGLACDMDEINYLARKHNLLVFEDAAQAIGSTYKNRKTGSLANGASFSFYPTKNLGALGDAGIVTTSDKYLAKKVREIRNYGSTKKYLSETIGKNSRLDEIQACFLKIKIKNLNNENLHRNKLAKIYLEKLSFLNKKKLILPRIEDKYNFSSIHLFVIRSKFRDKLHEFLAKKGITTMFHYPVAPHMQNCFKDHELSKYSLPISEEIHKTCISLPISCLHTNKEINYVCDNVIEFYEMIK